MLDKLLNTPSCIIRYALCRLGENILLSSYWVCLIAGLIGLILYIFGYEKGRKAPMLSIAIYLIINIIGRVILNV